MRDLEDLVVRWRRVLAAPNRLGLSLGQPVSGPASDAEIEALERRIGRALPPSYRALLAISGAAYPGWSLPPGEVDLLPRKQPFISVIWVDPSESPFPLFDIQGSAARHLLANDRPDYCLTGHLLHAVVVCAFDGDSVLLDPLDMDADGEWRAWEWWKEGCSARHRSLLDMMEAKLASSNEPAIGPISYGDAELDRLAAELNSDKPSSDAAAAELESRVRQDSVQPLQRAPAMYVLLNSESEPAKAAVTRLMAAFPDDPVVIGNAISARVTVERGPDIEAALRRSLVGPNGSMFASALVWRWPEIVDHVWRETRDPMLLQALLNARQPGSMHLALEALMDPGLESGTRSLLTYTLSHTVRYHPDPPEPEALLAAARLPDNDHIHLAQALLGWGEVDGALGLLGAELEEDIAPSGIGMVRYMLNEIAEMAPPQAVPVLIASLRRRPTAQVLRTLAFIDHPDTVPAIAEQLDGAIRGDALIALEQLATPAALDGLAERARSGDVDCARALARHRDHRAFGPLVLALNGPSHRSAVSGLSDLRAHEALALLDKMVAEDPDDDVATIAAHGIVMTAPGDAAPAVRMLAQRADPDVQALAAHWLTLLT